MVVRGLIDKPLRIDTPLGTLSDAGHYFTPKLSRRILHQVYLGYPDSAAARGETGLTAPAPSDSKGAAEQRSPRQPRPPARAAATRIRVPRPVKRLVRLVPGVHW
jgi:hypothetical protein